MKYSGACSALFLVDVSDGPCMVLGKLIEWEWILMLRTARFRQTYCAVILANNNGLTFGLHNLSDYERNEKLRSDKNLKLG